MPVNVVLKRSILINGKEYESIDEVPQEEREALTEALGSLPYSSESGRLTAKVSVNGQTYASEADLPPALRGLIEGALAATASKSAGAPAIRPESAVSVRSLVLVAALLVILGLLAWRAF